MGVFVFVCFRSRYETNYRCVRFAGGRGRPPLQIVSTGIADLPAGARRRRGEGAPPYRGGKRHFKRILIRDGSPFAPARFLDYARNDEAKCRDAWFAGGRGRPPLQIVSTGIADLPTAARRRADEELPYRALPKINTGVADLPSTARRKLIALSGVSDGAILCFIQLYIIYSKCRYSSFCSSSSFLIRVTRTSWTCFAVALVTSKRSESFSTASPTTGILSISSIT